MSDDLSKRRLGRGLAALIGQMDQPLPVDATPKEIRPDRMVPIEHVSRGLAHPTLLLRYSSSWMIDKSCRALFHKGRDYQREVEKARSDWDFDLIIHPSAVENDSVILEISGLRPKV